MGNDEARCRDVGRALHGLCIGMGSAQDVPTFSVVIAVIVARRYVAPIVPTPFDETLPCWYTVGHASAGGCILYVL